MPTLPSKRCPCCNHPIAEVEFQGPVRPATSYEKCLRRCEPCAVGVSNRVNNPTFIYREPLKNIPSDSRANATNVLSNALNERNRDNKRLRFGFSTSEDAVTWVVFTYLLSSGQLEGALRRVRLIDAGALAVKPTILLWGVPIATPPSCDRRGGAEIRRRLIDLCADLGEKQASFSEPDVIIDLSENGLILIEAKYLSGNDSKPVDYKGWTTYLGSSALAWDTDKIRNSRCYELARNWRLLKGLAGERMVTLVNLGQPDLFLSKDDMRLNLFVEALRTDERSRFTKLTWSDLLGTEFNNMPDWFVEFCRGRRLIS
jgi:hypothetical protein